MSLAVTIGIIFTGCSPQQDSIKKTQTEQKQSSEQHSTGDLREATANMNQLPSFVKKLDPQIAQVYQIAAKNTDLLNWIPCYCGCGESANHKSNRDCFINQIKTDGTIVWDDHGTKCGTCLDIAIESADLKKQGKSNLEIRNYIDNKYKDQYAKPTPTPMPS